MRTTYHATSGIQSPHSDAEVDVLIDLGRSLAVILSKVASRIARNEFRRAAGRARRSNAKRDKQAATSWYLVAKLAAELADSDTSGAHHRAPSSRHPRDVWTAFSVLASWYVREGSTIRVAPHGSDSPGPTAKKKIWSHFRRRGISSRVSTYRTLRQQQTTTPENPKHDPLLKLHEAVCTAIATAAPGRRGMAAVLPAVDKKWGTVSAALPSAAPERIALLIGQLLLLKVNVGVWTHDLDFLVEPLLREVILDATRRYVQALLAGATLPAERSALLAAAFEAVANQLAFNLTMTLEIANQPPLICPPAPVVLEETRRALAVSAAEIERFLTEIPMEASIMTAWKLSVDVTESVMRALSARPEYPNLQGGFSSGTAKHPWTGEDLKALYSAIVAYLVDLRNFTLKDVMHASGAQLTDMLLDASERRFGQTATCSVAIPTSMYSSSCSLPVGALVSESALNAAWGNLAGATAPGPQGPSRIAILVDEVPARTDHAALQHARSVGEREAAVLWFAVAKSADVELTDSGRIRRTAAGPTYVQYARRSGLGPPRDHSSSDLLKALDVLERLRSQARDESKQHDVWQKVGAGLSFLKAGLATKQIHERFLNIWLALEGIFSGFDWEEKPYEKLVPIGTRIAYRCATVVPPRQEWLGRTFAEMRWGAATELLALYRIRCATVHEGERFPAVDEVVLGRWVDTAVMALSVVVESVLEFGARSVEEVVAYYEARYPGNRVIA